MSGLFRQLLSYAYLIKKTSKNGKICGLSKTGGSTQHGASPVYPSYSQLIKKENAIHNASKTIDISSQLRLLCQIYQDHSLLMTIMAKGGLRAPYLSNRNSTSGKIIPQIIMMNSINNYGRHAVLESIIYR
ncbi:MAG: hypothetical protein GC154_11010 [bacterium]|nr:hypothetical protein [bacterium]